MHTHTGYFFHHTRPNTCRAGVSGDGYGQCIQFRNAGAMFVIATCFFSVCVSSLPSAVFIHFFNARRQSGASFLGGGATFWCTLSTTVAEMCVCAYQYHPNSVSESIAVRRKNDWLHQVVAERDAVHVRLHSQNGVGAAFPVQSLVQENDICQPASQPAINVSLGLFFLFECTKFTFSRAAEAFECLLLARWRFVGWAWTRMSAAPGGCGVECADREMPVGDCANIRITCVVELVWINCIGALHLKCEVRALRED